MKTQNNSILLIVILIFFPFHPYGIGIDSIDFQKGKPPRIIRTCCAFGSDVGLVGIPFVKLSDVIAIEDIGSHTYLGGGNEGNGIIYSQRGGFIDIGHLRDLSDWTAFLHKLIMENKGNSTFELELGREGGLKLLKLSIPETISNNDAANLAGRIAYDLSVWHEIATWYGVSSVPLVPERYSSFSVEDDYSNQLGILIGIEAILSKTPFQEAMAELTLKHLAELKAVKTIEETYYAMELVNGEWWSRHYKFPSKHLLLMHNISDYAITYPLLVPELSSTSFPPIPINLVNMQQNNKPLTELYSLEFKTNAKIPVKEIFPERNKKAGITNLDFLHILDHIKTETQQLKYSRLKRKQKREIKKNAHQ